MKNKFAHTGYRLSAEQTPGSRKISCSYIPNPDGRIRWFWNTNSQKPLFLKFYNISGKKAKLFAFFIHFIFLIRLQKLIFRKEILYFTEEENTVFDLQKDWAIFTGTVGPNNKVLLFSEHFFYKIASTENAKKLIENEFQSLKTAADDKNFTTPISKMVNDYVLQLSDISADATRTTEFTTAHTEAIFEISKKKEQCVKIADWNYLQDLIKKFESLNDERHPKNLLRKLNLIIDDINKNENIDLSFSHGDFTSWNCYVKADTLGIYDWELASFERPKAFDFFHFIIQNGILIQKKSWALIFQEILTKNKMAFDFPENELKKYLKFYLLINTLNYLKIYADQKEWHLQIHWLLETWSEGFNLFINDQKTERELVIMDLFDSLQHHQYATLKFHEEEPEKLGINSDIDMLISSFDAKKVIVFLRENSLVEKVEIVKKSFMSTVRIITKNHQILNLDLIQKLKWKNLEFMKVGEILSQANRNSFGVKCASPEHTAKYLHLFYTLNGAKIPEKYKNLVAQNFPKKVLPNKSETIKILKMRKYNRGFSLVKNTLQYLKDSFAEKGFIITFSGVDGAGKSTVISEISELIEKQYRRPVKVLRHRPSLLPILSVWTKGKEQAHLDAVNSLPRQGKNKSSLSSLLRFGYYYTDYILGQFFIYTKYIIRGKIVLYDRYYFDFIADPKRSNIQLPKAVAETGYHLLMKPKFNFFLYASPEKILSRKKELSYNAICDLTSAYSKLFTKLDKKNQNANYLSIENNDLDTTLGTIMNTIITTK